jgi:hypothetical protein
VPLTVKTRRLPGERSSQIWPSSAQRPPDIPDEHRVGAAAGSNPTFFANTPAPSSWLQPQPTAADAVQKGVACTEPRCGSRSWTPVPEWLANSCSVRGRDRPARSSTHTGLMNASPRAALLIVLFWRPRPFFDSENPIRQPAPSTVILRWHHAHPYTQCLPRRSP